MYPAPLLGCIDLPDPFFGVSQGRNNFYSDPNYFLIILLQGISQLWEADVEGNLEEIERKAMISGDFIVEDFWENSLYSTYTRWTSGNTTGFRRGTGLMEHIPIVIGLLTVLLGVGLVVYLFQISNRLPYQFLKSMFHLVLFVQLMALVALNYEYLLTNLLDGQPAGISNWSAAALLAVVLLAEAGMVYKMAEFCADLLSAGFSRRLRALIFAWAGVFGAGHVFRFVFVEQPLTDEGLYLWHEAWIFSMLALILWSLAVLWRRSAADRYAAVRPMSRAFAALMSGAYFIMLLNQLNFYAFQLNLDILNQLSMLAVNLAFVVWLGRYFPALRAKLAEGSVADDLARLAGRYDVSTREQEIIRALLLGKSNKEISEDLFISAHTVKNHLYNIYQKLGVKTRAQLQHLVHSLDD